MGLAPPETHRSIAGVHIQRRSGTVDHDGDEPGREEEGEGDGEVHLLTPSTMT